MDELERAGRALRDSVEVAPEASEHLRARARTIVRRRRVFAAGSIATVVVVASIGVAVAVSGGDGLGVHTIAPAGSSTTLRTGTTDMKPTVPTTTAAPRNYVQVQALPILAFADALHGWRVEPLNRRTLEHTTDGGYTWTKAQINVPGEDTSLTGVVVIDDRHVFSIVVNGIGNAIPRLIRTTDGVRWSQTRGVGMPSEPNAFSVAFSDAAHGWAVTQFGDLLATADGGDNWTMMHQPVPGARQSVGAVCAVSPQSGWAATGDAVYRSDDNGVSWAPEATVQVGGGIDIALVCHGDHAAYASFGVGAGQHTGAFFRTDDGGAHWHALIEDTQGGTPITAPGFSDSQFRGIPQAMTADGTLMFEAGCNLCGFGQHWVVVHSPSDRFVVEHFDGSKSQIVVQIAEAAIDATHLFTQVQRAAANGGGGPRPVSFYASNDGGNTWELRWSDPG